MFGRIISVVGHRLSVLVRQPELGTFTPFVLLVHEVNRLVEVIKHSISHVSEVCRAFGEIIFGQFDEINVAVFQVVRPVVTPPVAALRCLHASLACLFIYHFIQVDNFTCEHITCDYIILGVRV